MLTQLVSIEKSAQYHRHCKHFLGEKLAFEVWINSGLKLTSFWTLTRSRPVYYALPCNKLTKTMIFFASQNDPAGVHWYGKHVWSFPAKARGKFRVLTSVGYHCVFIQILVSTKKDPSTCSVFESCLPIITDYTKIYTLFTNFEKKCTCYVHFL